MPGQRVFISYGRRDAQAFVRRLARDLASHGGHRVWLDVDAIDAGEAWEVSIEQGIRDASVFAAVLTKRSTEEDSICRDELLFALNEGKRVVPLLATAKHDVPRSLLLARRNWIDFTEDYEEGLRRLLRFLEGDESGTERPALGFVGGVRPLDFSLELARHASGFVGRDWLFGTLRRRLEDRTSPVLVLVGEPGSGKSAIAARLATTWDEVVAAHFCSRTLSRSTHPAAFVAGLVTQMAEHVPGFFDQLEERGLGDRWTSALDAFRELVLAPCSELPEATGPCLVVVDALDEGMGEAEDIVDVLAAYGKDLPRWLTILATTRDDARVLTRLADLPRLELSTDAKENLRDVRAIVHHGLAARHPDIDLEGETERIAEASAGNVLCARLLLETAEPGREGSSECVAASGLDAFYASEFRHRFPDPTSYATEIQPLLGALAVARERVPVDLLRTVAATTDERLHARLLRLRPLLHVWTSPRGDAYSLYHKSLADWITDPQRAGAYWCSPRSAHGVLAEALRGPDARKRTHRSYALHSLAHHLFLAEEWEALDELIDAEFLRSKLSRHGMAILEDIAYLAQVLLATGDVDAAPRCIALVEQLDAAAGGGISAATRTTVRGARATPRRPEILCPELPQAAGLDVYAGLIPAADASADFVECFEADSGLVVAVGDAPGSGLKSAFSARFVGSAFQSLVEEVGEAALDRVLGLLDDTLRANAFFDVMSLQCALVQPESDSVFIASAGHPSPVLVSGRRQTVDRIPLPGALLNLPVLKGRVRTQWQMRVLPFEPGDLLVLLSDGLTEGHRMDGGGYGYSFRSGLLPKLHLSARRIALSILEEFLERRRDDSADDVTILVVKKLDSPTASPGGHDAGEGI